MSDEGWGHFADDDVAHLAATFYAVETYHLLGENLPAEMKSLKADIHTLHPYDHPKEDQRCRVHAQEMHEYTWMEALLARRLGVDIPKAVVSRANGPWTGGVSGYSHGYEKGQNPVLIQEVHKLLIRNELGVSIKGRCSEEFTKYLDARERADGSYNETPAADGSGGHLVNTLYAIKARRLIDTKWQPKSSQGSRSLRDGIRPEAGLIAWVRACQRADGGFTWAPRPILGDVSDMWYTHAGVELLTILGAKPADEAAVAEWIESCRAPEGGFGDRPGTRAMPQATFLALDTLRMLMSRRGASGTPVGVGEDTLSRRGANGTPVGNLNVGSTRGPARTPLATASRRLRRGIPATGHIPTGLRCWTVQLEAPGEGSVREAVRIAQEEKIHLWGVKNAKPGWVEAAQAEAKRQGVDVTFFVSDEFYNVWARVPGFGTYSHFIDPVRPADVKWPAQPREVQDWAELRDAFFIPLRAQGGFTLWQISDHECVARILLDESLKNGGYDAIGTFHFGCFEMSWLLPFTLRYVDDLPLMTNQDAHGETWWWRENLTAMRNVFLAERPTLDSLRAAMKAKRVVSVRRDSHTGGKLRLVGGTPEARAHVKAHEAEWSASGVQPDEFSIQVLRPADVFEVGHPEGKGITVRVRQNRAWRETDWLQPARYRLQEAKIGDRYLAFENRTLRQGHHYETKYNRDIYDVIFIPEDITTGTLELRFDPVDPKFDLQSVTRRVPLSTTPNN